MARSNHKLEMVGTIMFADDVLRGVNCFVNAGERAGELNKLIEEGKARVLGVLENMSACREGELSILRFGRRLKRGVSRRGGCGRRDQRWEGNEWRLRKVLGGRERARTN